MKIVHIIYISEDGLISLRCGVGTIARHFISSFPEIANRFKSKGVRLKLSAITLTSNESSVGVSKKIEKETKRICNKFNGDLYFIKSERKPFDEYFNFKLWKTYTDKINSIITKIISSCDYKIIVVANDTIFAKVMGNGKGIINVWIPHSLAEAHSQSYVNNSERVIWEKEAINYKNLDENGFIGYISPYAKKLLIKINASNSKLVPFYNGFHISLLNKLKKTQNLVKKMIKKRGIPLDKKIIFSFGRADEYKGLDIALQVIVKIVKKYKHYHGVLIASAFSKEEIVNRVQNKLKKILEKNRRLPITLFFGYEFVLPKYILQYSNTKFLLHLPTKDFCPLVPFEAAIIGHKKLSIINSNIECFEEIVKNNQNGFLCKPEVKPVFRRVEKIISEMSGKKLNDIILKGRIQTLAQRNLVINYFTTLYFLIK